MTIPLRRWAEYNQSIYDAQGKPMKNGVQLYREFGWNGNGMGTSGKILAVAPNGLVIAEFPLGSKSVGSAWVQDGERRIGGFRREYRWHHYGRPNQFREYHGPTALKQWKDAVRAVIFPKETS